jgi:hypothetical protein
MRSTSPFACKKPSRAGARKDTLIPAVAKPVSASSFVMIAAAIAKSSIADTAPP